MTHPIIVGFISIIPGLGFSLFRRYRQAIFIFILTAGLLSLSFFSPWQALKDFLLFLALAFWIMQISMAVRMARAIKSLDYELPSASFGGNEVIQIPPELSGKEKKVFKIRETLRQQLEFSENLVEGIYAVRGKYGGHYYVGLSDKNLIVLELDLLYQPLYARIIARSDIEKIQHKSGILNDSLVFFPRNAKPIKFEVPFQHKDKIYPIVRELEKNAHVI